MRLGVAESGLRCAYIYMSEVVTAGPIKEEGLNFG